MLLESLRLVQYSIYALNWKSLSISSTFATYPATRKQFVHVTTNIVHTNITAVEVFSLSAIVGEQRPTATTASDCER